VFGHADIGQDDVRAIGLYALDGLSTVADGNHLHIFIGEGQLDDPLNGDAIVCEQELVRHSPNYLNNHGLVRLSSTRAA
jgi:hypothetical protein